MTRPVLLVHGGLGEDMDSERFWCRPGIVAGLQAAGFDVTAPDRDTCPSSWSAAADALAAKMSESGSIVAGSNAVSVAVRLAIEHRPLVDRLVLLWPATRGDPIVDAAAPAAVSHLLAGETLRGVTDYELATLDVPTAVMASDPPNRVHAERTVNRLVEVIRGATRIRAGYPESPRPEFEQARDAFLEALIPYLR